MSSEPWGLSWPPHASLSRRARARAFTLAVTGVVAAALHVGCGTKPLGAVVLEFQSELVAGKDIGAVALYIQSSAGGPLEAEMFPVVAQDQPAPAGAARELVLPGTLPIEIVAGDPTPISIKVVAFRASRTDPDAMIPTIVREFKVVVPRQGTAELPITFGYANLDTAAGPTVSIGGLNIAGKKVPFDVFGYSSYVVASTACAAAGATREEDGTCGALQQVADGTLASYDPRHVFGGGASTGAGGTCFALNDACVRDAAALAFAQPLVANEAADVVVPYPAGVTSLQSRTLLVTTPGTQGPGVCSSVLGSCALALASPEVVAAGASAPPTAPVRRFPVTFDDAAKTLTLKKGFASQLATLGASLVVAPACCGAHPWSEPPCNATITGLATHTNTCQ